MLKMTPVQIWKPGKSVFQIGYLLPPPVSAVVEPATDLVAMPTHIVEEVVTSTSETDATDGFNELTYPDFWEMEED
jgi:hypothetical protein